MSAGQVVNPFDCQVTTTESGLQIREMIHPNNYAEPLILRHLMLELGSTPFMNSPDHDELLYVLDGDCSIEISQGGEVNNYSLATGSAVQVLCGSQWRFMSAENVTVLSFLVPAPPAPWAQALAKPTQTVVDVAKLGAQLAESATSDRQFEVLFNAERGSRGATMFVGFIPTSGAPEHYHLYDEICVIVRGSGAVHTLDIKQELGVGSAFHVAPRLLHAIENPNLEDLWLLGVFRPEGSAAAAYYPDGRPAPNNED
jgi:quercetin dioxygenase-like cupin family protein